MYFTDSFVIFHIKDWVKNCFTLSLHFGGNFLNQLEGVPTYEWGTVRKWDFVQLKELTMQWVNGLCDEVSVKEVRKIYVDKADSSWMFIGSNKALKEAYKEHCKDREFHLYVEGEMVEAESDGSSNNEAQNLELTLCDEVPIDCDNEEAPGNGSGM